MPFVLEKRFASAYGGGPSMPGQVGPSIEEADEESSEKRAKDQPPKWGPMFFKMFESAATTFASLMVLG